MPHSHEIATAEPRLDRLSALLEGLAPRVRLGAQHDELSLHIVTDREGLQQQNAGLPVPVSALTLLVCPPGHAPHGDHNVWMSFAVAFNGPVGPLFLAELTEAMALPLAQADPSLSQIVQLIAAEMQVQRCGQPFLMERAGDILLIGLLRQWVARPASNAGLFKGLADARIAKTLVAMHAKPSEAWTLEALALEAGMSRTSFANQFKRMVQVSPGKYLETLRMAIARRMVSSGESLKRITEKTGYASPSTLSRAMSRRRG